MAFNEKLITPDIVQILDVKIFTKSAHPEIFIFAGEPYDDVLDNLQLQVLTPAEKEAIDATATVPSASNPVVLKLDIPVYYPVQNLGEVKDAVNDVSDLPLTVTPTGDTLLGSPIVSNVSSMSSVVPQQLVSGPGIPANAYIVSVGVNQFEMNLAATATAAGVSLTVTSALDDVRPVLNANALYRWDGSNWVVFVNTGTLDHTQLINQDSDPNFQHLDISEKTTLSGLSHIHGFYFDPADVNISTDTITKTAHGLLNDTVVNIASSGTLPGGLVAGTPYYVVGATTNTFQLSLALGGGAIDITSQGTNGTHSNSHVLSKVPFLEQITDAGSGIIISNDERNRLPSQDEKNALLGTQGTPSLTNRYVTNADPRLNTVRNPYVSVGNNAQASYPGNEISAFDAAFEGVSTFPCSISVASPAVVTVNHIYENGDVVFFRPHVVGTTGVTTNGSNVITDVSSLNSVVIGQNITGPGIPVGTTVTGIGSTTITISNAATIDSNPVTPSNPAVPFVLTSTLPTGISAETVYYVRNATPTTFNVSLTPAGPLVDTTTAGAGLLFVGGNNQFVKAIQVLPLNYVMHALGNFANLRWDLQDDSLLLESMDPHGATLNWRTLTDALEILPPGTGAVTVRGFKFTLDGGNTRGIRIARERCVIEDCIFTGLTSDAENHKGITIEADWVSVSRCVFESFLVSGIDVNGNNCRIENCKFDLNSGSSYAVNVFPNKDNTKIYSCQFNNCTIQIQAGCTNTQLNENQFLGSVTFTDAGVNTRFLNLPANDATNYGQAFYGKTRTVGNLGSMADYRGNSEAVFIAALSDPYVQEVQVLDGTYVFSASVTVPAGKRVRGVTQGSSTKAVFIVGNPGIVPFILSDYSTLEFLKISASSADCVSVPAGTNFAAVLSSILNTTTSGYAVNIDTTDDCSVRYSEITGLNGIRVVGSNRTNVQGNSVSVSGNTVLMDVVCDACQLKDNHFLSGNSTFAGSRHIIEGNHFTSGAPSKLLTSASVWENNWSHPSSNNFYGVDYRVIPFDKYLDPRSPGCDRTVVLDTGCLSFLKTGDGHSITLPIFLGFKVDLTSGFSVTLHWTSNASIGDVRWQVTVVFRDSVTKQFGTPLVQYATSSRTNLAIKEEDSITLNFPASYGLPALINPTHVSVDVTRLPADPADNLPTDAILTAGEISLRREL